MAKIDILLSTYNGATYLEEQLESIVNQSYDDWILRIRDDGSADNTIEIIDKYVDLYPNKIFRMEDDLGNLGVVRSFEQLLLGSQAEYIMFSDQDDVWMKDKIGITLLEMERLDSPKQDIPIVVCTDLKVVDSNLNELLPSMWYSGKILPNILKNSFNYLAVNNFITGCTMMINRSARDAVLPFVEGTTMHDIYIGLKVLANGGVIEPIFKPTILYRQHSSNLCGMPMYDHYISSKIRNISSVIKANKLNYNMVRQIREINILTYLKYKILYFIKRQQR